MPPLLAIEWDGYEARLAVARTRGNDVTIEHAFSVALLPRDSSQTPADVNVGDRITAELTLVVPGGDDLAGVDDDGADRHVVVVEGPTRLGDRLADARALYPFQAVQFLAQYGFAGHKGYGAPEHLEALATYGPTPENRLTFRSVLPRREARA